MMIAGYLDILHLIGVWLADAPEGDDNITFSVDTAPILDFDVDNQPFIDADVDTQPLINMDVDS